MVRKRTRSKSELSRVSGEMKDLINTIRAKYIMEGRKPPTTSQITKHIAKKTNMEDLWYDIQLKF